MSDNPQGEPIKLEGKDNNGKPRQEFANRLAAKTDNEFVKFTENCIWLSAYAASNPRSDYHWQAEACLYDARRRGKPELYDRAWQRASGKE